MVIILDGKKLSIRLTSSLINKVKESKVKLRLAIIQIGDLEASAKYIRRKKEFADKIGVEVLHKKYKVNTKDSEIIYDISEFNTDDSIHGIILQLPIPISLNRFKLIESINPKKDVDGLTAENTRLLLNGTPNLIPATTRGIFTLLDKYKIKLDGKKVVVVGRSLLVGKPTALAFLNKNATVTICHSRTKNLVEETKRADILVVATGHPHLIKRKHVNKNQVVIDVGISIKGNGKVVGDVDFENVKNIVRAITPVPGGIGPMTVLSLFENLMKAHDLSKVR